MILDREFEAAVGRDVHNSEAIFLSRNDVDPSTGDGRSSDVATDAVNRTRIRYL